MKNSGWGSAIVLSALLAQPASAANPVARYSCDDGTRFVATFRNAPQGPGSVLLAYANAKSVVLPQALSADGGRYVSGKTEFWIKGNQASFTRGTRQTTCRTR
jgi:membrane-bound inhibitor of C-type lysozyme